jgi:diguanylate cyclase (GGDEF)-like protein
VREGKHIEPTVEDREALLDEPSFRIARAGEQSEIGQRESGPGDSPAPAVAAPEGPFTCELIRLGEALLASADVVLDLTIAQTLQSPNATDPPPVQAGFEDICNLATVAVANWMAGGDPHSGFEVERDASAIFRGLLAEQAIPLSEVTRRCLRWRDATVEVLNECARQLAISRDVLLQAQTLVQINLDITLVHLSVVFDEERRHTDEELALRQEELAFTATHDTLTGLPNRALMLDRGHQMLVRARRHQTPVAALSIDLDDFKSINDTLGRGAGDELLRAFAGRLQEVVRESDAVGRIGGDEFLLIVDELTLAAGAEVVAERLQVALREPFQLSDEQRSSITVTASIGIASGERVSIEELLRDADVARYRAKRDERNSYVVFQDHMHTALQSRMELDQDLRQATINREFLLVYQPTFDLKDMSPTGMEALIRWQHPLRGQVAPNDFIPLLEENGMITEVGRWVLEEACLQGARWRRQGFSIGIAVNVSARQLERDEFVAEVEEALTASGLEPSALTLEITETTIMRDPSGTAARLASIKKLGVRLAIDDFGTGYSSLSHLQQLPVDSLKIDRSFICQLSGNPDGEKLIHTLVQLGKALSIETLAEGIEQHDELSLLRDEQCDSGQGFLFAKPLTVEAASAFLKNWHGDRDLAERAASA